MSHRGTRLPRSYEIGDDRDGNISTITTVGTFGKRVKGKYLEGESYVPNFDIIVRTERLENVFA